MQMIKTVLLLLVCAQTQAQPRFKAVKENLGPFVNDQHDQVLPVFEPGQKTLFFSQNTGPAESYEVWQTKLEGSRWAPKQKATGINGPSALNQYVFGSYPPQWLLINGRFDAADSTLFSKGFSWYRPLGQRFSAKQSRAFVIDELETMLQGRFANAFYHPQKRVLLLSFGENGKNDLWLCTPKPGQQEPLLYWNKPVRLPNAVNSAFDDSCPFLDESGTVLYFSSNRPGGYGADDIYCSRALDPNLLQWTPAQNLGFYVNSNKSELYYTTATDGQAYFVSYKNSYGAGDIFRIRFEMDEAWNSIAAGMPVSTNPPAAAVPALRQTFAGDEKPVITSDQLPPELYKPNNVLFLLDVSQSMSQGTKMALLRKSADALLGRLRYIDRFALVSFGERARLQYATPSLRHKEPALQVLQSLQPNEGETFINPGLALAYQQCKAQFIDSGNNEVMVITDGYFSINPASIDLIKANPGIRLSFVLVDAGTIEQNIVRYIRGRFPEATIVQISNETTDLTKLLEAVKVHSKR